VGPKAERVTFEHLMAGIEQDYRLQDHRSLYRLQVARARWRATSRATGR
jgi:hypothetical protein